MLPPEKLERHPLTVCLRILQGLGKPGEYVWRYSKEIPGLEQRIDLSARRHRLAAGEGRRNDLARAAGRLQDVHRERAAA